MGWLKLNEVLEVKNPTGTGVKPEVELTPPDAVSTQVTPQVTSKVSDGFIVGEAEVVCPVKLSCSEGRSWYDCERLTRARNGVVVHIAVVGGVEAVAACRSWRHRCRGGQAV